MKTQLEWTNGALISTAKYGAIEYTASDQVAYFNCGESCWQNRLYAEFGRGNFKKLCQSHHDALCEQVERAVEGVKPKWISLEERLPEINQHCLVFLKGGYTDADEWIIHHESPVSFSSHAIPTGAAWRDYDLDDVTHWQPLPEPPR